MGRSEQPRPQGAFPWLWKWDGPTFKARENRPGDEVAIWVDIQVYAEVFFDQKQSTF